MRILFVTKRYYTNQDLIEAKFGRLFHLPASLAELGHDVSVIAVDYRRGGDETRTVSAVTFSSLGVRGLSAFRAWSKIKSVTAEFDPEVLIGSADTYLGWVAMRAAHRLRSRSVFDVYDNYLSFASARIPAMKWLFRRVLGGADLVTAVSDPLREIAAANGATAVKIVNGVDRTLFRPMDRREARGALGLDLDAEYIGYVGSIEPNRGIESMLHAVAGIRGAGRDVRLVLAGAKRLAIDVDSEGIEYRGLVPQAEVPAIINSCNIAVLPYLATEWGRYTFPNKLAEYAACGVPIVASELPEFVGTLGSDYHGLYPPGDSTAMKRAMSLQLDDPARPDVSSVASWPDIARLLEAELLHLVGQ
jgi:glycosyltransferase involved in cell wall biosynthesis